MQKQIMRPGPLHTDDGRLSETGYATRPIKIYDRGRIPAPPRRIKEWDSYLIASERYALALTIADNGYMGLDSVSLMDFDAPFAHTASRVQLFTMGRKNLPPASGAGNVSVKGRDYAVTFENDGKKRRLYGHMERFAGEEPILFDVTLRQEPQDSMVLVTPFAGDPKAFYYNQKINCLRAEGKAMWRGGEYLFAPAHSFAVLDWGRGVWPCRNTWFWGSASGLVNGRIFGFNIGCGIGDAGAATENMVFYQGQAHKLSQVQFEIPMAAGKADDRSPWRAASDDGRFAMDFFPVAARTGAMDYKLLCARQHQAFGRFTGKVRLDDGTVLAIRDFPGFVKKVYTKW